MYLAVLNETQKKLFLGLAYHIAQADGVYHDAEKSMMAAYCLEAQIELDETITAKTAEAIIDELSDVCGEREKKIIIFEAIGLAMADNIRDIAEEKLIRTAITKLGVTEAYSAGCVKLLKNYMQLQGQINQLVIE